MKELVACVAVLALGVAAPIAAEDFDDVAAAAYERGDYLVALGMWLPLAEQGDAIAQHNVGLMYYNGQGVPQDYAEAVKWYRRAANQGIQQSQYDLAMMYDGGKGVPQDYVEAVRWYRTAAEQGYAPAQNNLGVMYGKGEGVPQDYVEAHKWYNLAAAKATDRDLRELAAKNRDLLAAKMTPAQIAEAQKLAREWNPKQ